MKLTKKKNDDSTIRKVYNDDKSICYGLVGKISDLLKEGVGRGEVLSLEVGQGDAAAHLVDVVDSGLGGSVELVLTLGCTKEDI